jgi:hypothetical protein
MSTGFLVWSKCSSFSLYPQMKSYRVHCTPKNLDVPSKMKIKGYMYPQMKKPVDILKSNPFRLKGTLISFDNNNSLCPIMKSLELPGNSNKQHYADYPIFFREIGS